MSREWKSSTDRRWVMRCDRDGCATELGPYPRYPQPDLQQFADDGWFIALVHGDRCPECVSAGLVNRRTKPHPKYPSPMDLPLPEVSE